jgi:ferrochelatase
MPVYVGMRNWRPFIKDAVKAIADQGYERVVAICLAPQNSRTSVGMYRRAVMGDERLPFQLDFVEEWHDQPLLAQAFAEKFRSGWDTASAEHGGKLPVIFTAHSVPERTITEGDPYEAQSKETAELVGNSAGLPASDWRFAFQSQGMSGGAWIGPTVEDTILKLKAQGHTGVFVQPVGFLCDHVEVLYDIDIAFKQFAEDQGMRLWRAESLNGSSKLTEALASIVRARLDGN